MQLPLVSSLDEIIVMVVALCLLSFLLLSLFSPPPPPPFSLSSFSSLSFPPYSPFFKFLGLTSKFGALGSGVVPKKYSMSRGGKVDGVVFIRSCSAHKSHYGDVASRSRVLQRDRRER